MSGFIVSLNHFLVMQFALQCKVIMLSLNKKEGLKNGNNQYKNR